MKPFTDGEAGDAAFIRFYEANQEKCRPILESLQQLHAAPPECVDYINLANAAYQAFGIDLRALSADQIRHLLYLLGRQYGRIELNFRSFELAGLDLSKLTAGLRASVDHAGTQPAPQAPGIVSGENPQPRQAAAIRPRGMAPNVVRHQAIAKIGSRHAPRWREDGGCWRPKLEAICADLDATNESDDGPLDIPHSWRIGRTPCLKGIRLNGWRDAGQLARKLVIDHIRIDAGIGAAVLPHQSDPIEIAKIVGVQEQGIHHAEDSRVRADA